MRWISIVLTMILVLAGTTAAEAGVGSNSFLVTDASRADSLKPSYPRQWMVDVYYPAATGDRTSPYLGDSVLLRRLVVEQYYGQSKDALRGWAMRSGAALRGARQRVGQPPLIVILPGFGVVRANYQYLAAAFVRRGFAVAVIDLPYLGEQRLPDGRVLSIGDDPMAQSNNPADYAPRLREFVRDVSITLDRLPSFLHFDAHSITVTGHSSGGAVAVDVCGSEVRVSACVNWEGGIEATRTMHSGAAKPTLIGASRAKGRPETAVDATHPDMLTHMLNDMHCASCWVIKVTGGSHMSYSDAPLVMPDTLSRFGGVLISPARSFDLYPDLTAAFAHAYAPGGGGDEAFAKALKSNPEITRWDHAVVGRGGRRPARLRGAPPFGSNQVGPPTV